MESMLNHASFTSIEDIDQLCRSFISTIKIKFFGQNRIFPNGEFNFLTTKRDWAEWGFIEKGIPPAGYLHYDELQDGIYFPQMDTNHVVFGAKEADFKHYKEQFDVRHPMVIVKKYDNFMDIFGIDVHDDNPYELYLMQQDYFENFIAFFKDRTRDLRQKIDSNLLKVDETYLSALKTKQATTQVAERSRLAELKINYRDLYHNNRFTMVSEREYACLEALAKGGTAKTIGYILGISHRTVETHLCALKAKFDVSSKQELLALYYENRLLK